VNGTRLEFPERIHVNFVLFVKHNKWETQLFTREWENENIQALYLGKLYELRKNALST